MGHEEVEEWRVVRYSRPRQDGGDFFSTIGRIVVVLVAIVAISMIMTAMGCIGEKKSAPISKPAKKVPPPGFTIDPPGPLP